MDIPPLSPPHFRRTQRKVGEKRRTIDEPDEEARQFNEALLRDLYRLKLPMPNATGGIPGRSLGHNIKPHAENRQFYMLDLENAYPSLNGDRLAAILSRYRILKTERVGKQILDQYCLDPETNGLILGAPASPYLFNIYCRAMDAQIQAFCEANGLTYTRYLDDLTISAPANTTIGLKRRAKIREIILNEGWRINHGKSRVHSLEKGPVTVTGISLYPDGYWKLSPKLVREVMEVYKELEVKLKAQNGYLSDKDRDRLAGYNGVLISTYDDRRGHPTAIEMQLIRKYQELRSQVKEAARKKGRIATKQQMTLLHPYSFTTKVHDWPSLDSPVIPRGPRSKYKQSTLLELDPTFLDNQVDE